MKKEDIAALGVDDATAQKVLDLVNAEYVKSGNYIPKAKFDSLNEEKKGLEERLKQGEKSLKDLEAKAGDNQALKDQIASLKSEQEKTTEEWKRKLGRMNVENAIRADLAGSAYDPDGALKFFDLDAIKINADGKLAGYEAQKADLVKSKSYLFKPSGAVTPPSVSGSAANNSDVPKLGKGGSTQSLASELGKQAANSEARYSPDYFFGGAKKQ